MRVRRGEVTALIGVLVAAVLVGVLGWVVVDAVRAREQMTRQMEAASAQARDMRAAQSQRITGLIEDMRELEGELAAREATIAAQSQAIADLTEQLRRAGEDPITGDPVPAPTAVETSESSTPRASRPSPTPGEPQESKSTAQGEPPSDAEPAPQPAPEPEPIWCLPLDLLCIG